MHPVLFRVYLPFDTLYAPDLLIGLALALLACAAALAMLAARAAAGIALGGALAMALVWLAMPALQLHARPIVMTTFGVSLACGGGLWVLATQRQGTRLGLHAERTATCSMVCAGVALVGARVGFLLTHGRAHDGEAAASPERIASLSDSGLCLPGAVVAGLLAALCYHRVARTGRAPHWLDATAPGLCMALCLGHLGEYAFGSGYGIALAGDSWWTELGRFPHWPDTSMPGGAGSPAWAFYVTQRALPWEASAAPPVHPLQLYSALGALACGAWATGFRKRFGGELFLEVTLGYLVLQLALYPLREPNQRSLLHAAVVSGLALAATTWLWRRRRPPFTGAAERS